MSVCQEIFSKAFSKIHNEIEYNHNWSNGVGFHDYAVYGEHAVILKSDDVARSVSPSGRRLIFIGTLLGTVVVFDRHTLEKMKKEHLTPEFVFNCTSAFTEGGWIQHGGVLKEGDLDILLGEDGDVSHNIGWRIHQIWHACNRTIQARKLASEAV